MKIAIIGAGAIGGYVGVKLALAGEDVTFIGRGANLDAIRKNGMKLVMSVASEGPEVYGPDTVVVTMQNGIPYWYFHKHGGELAGGIVRSVDPTGLIGRENSARMAM